MRRLSLKLAAFRGTAIVAGPRFANPTVFAQSSSAAAFHGASSSGWLRASAVRLQQNNGGDDEFEAFDPTASLQKEAVYVSRGTQVEDLVRAWLPSNAGEELRAKLRAHLHAFPVNDMIRNAAVTITHIENEKGEEVSKVPGVLQNESGKNVEWTLDSALELAQKYEGKMLVQLADRDGKSYCRIRDEKARFLKTVEAEVEALERALGGGTNANNANSGKKVRKMRDVVIHSFSDVVDAHFISWRNKKIVSDMEKCHPVKLVIQKFQNPDSAVTKMKEMLDAIKETSSSEGKNVVHHCSGIALNSNELSLTLMPVLDIENSKVKATRHPSEQDWTNAEKRLFEATGGRGTYQKSNVLKKQAIGAREFRTDRFGRRIE